MNKHNKISAIFKNYSKNGQIKLTVPVFAVGACHSFSEKVEFLLKNMQTGLKNTRSGRFADNIHFANRDNVFTNRDNVFADRDNVFADGDNDFADRNNDFENRDNDFADRDNDFADRDNDFADRDNDFADRDNDFENRDNDFFVNFSNRVAANFSKNLKLFNKKRSKSHNPIKSLFYIVWNQTNQYLHYSNSIIFENDDNVIAPELIAIFSEETGEWIFYLLIPLIKKHTQQYYPFYKEHANYFDGVIDRYCGVPP